MQSVGHLRNQCVQIPYVLYVMKEAQRARLTLGLPVNWWGEITNCPGHTQAFPRQKPLTLPGRVLVFPLSWSSPKGTLQPVCRDTAQRLKLPAQSSLSIQVCRLQWGLEHRGTPLPTVLHSELSSSCLVLLIQDSPLRLQCVYTSPWELVKLHMQIHQVWHEAQDSAVLTRSQIMLRHRSMDNTLSGEALDSCFSPRQLELKGTVRGHVL